MKKLKNTVILLPSLIGRGWTGVFFFTFLLLLFASCSRKTDRFKLEAEFKNLNQGEFYIYDNNTGQKDTIAVNDGRFVFERPLKDTLTLVILFPNYSEIPVFATPGGEVTMKGDATHLRDTELKGTPDNDLMTAFRLKTNEMTPPEAEAEAEKFINAHTDSPASLYLLNKFFLQSQTPDYSKAYQLCGIMHKKQPQNQHIARLLTQLDGLKTFTTSGPLPTFQAVSTEGDTVTEATMKSDVGVILAWAAWSYDSQSPMRTLSKLYKKHPTRLKVLSICLDASYDEGKGVLERDSVTWPNVCDSMMWQSPVLAKLGIATLPANIVTEKGRIVARNLSSSELQDKVKQMLGE